MLDINRVASAFYREVLADARGAAGRAYLARRGVSDDTASTFQLGYAPADWSLLSDHLKAKRVDLELAVRLGLIAHRPKSGGFYDRNRDRLVCPVIVPGGEIVGFSSRLVGTPRIRSPSARIRSAIRSSVKCTVEPVPRPTIAPSGTRSAAALPATAFGSTAGFGIAGS